MISDEDIPEADNKSQPKDDHNTEQTHEMFESYTDMEVVLPMGLDGRFFHTNIKRLVMDRDRNPIIKETNEPITDTRLYEEIYIYGTIETIAVNVIDENIFLQVDG